MIVYSDYGTSRWKVYWETPDESTETYDSASLRIVEVATLDAATLRKDMKGTLRRIADAVNIAYKSGPIIELSRYINKFLQDVDEKYHKVSGDDKLFQDAIDGLKRGIHILEMRGSTRLADGLKKSKEVFELLFSKELNE